MLMKSDLGVVFSIQKSRNLLHYLYEMLELKQIFAIIEIKLDKVKIVHPQLILEIKKFHRLLQHLHK